MNLTKAYRAKNFLITPYIFEKTLDILQNLIIIIKLRIVALTILGTAKCTTWYVQPATTLISLHICKFFLVKLLFDYLILPAWLLLLSQVSDWPKVLLGRYAGPALIPETYVCQLSRPPIQSHQSGCTVRVLSSHFGTLVDLKLKQSHLLCYSLSC